jgi:hypothetical protein
MVNINKKKVLEKWSSVLDKLDVKESSKREWIAEYAEYHQINENVAYANLGNISGMGAVVAPQPSALPGQTGYGTGVAGQAYGQGGVTGSGDYGQQLLPISMKVAAHTIGLDLVAVKPSAGPVIDLMYVDYRYDDGPLNEEDYNPIVFKIGTTDNTSIQDLIDELKAEMLSKGIRETQGGLTGRLFFNLAENQLSAVNPLAADRPQGGVVNTVVEPSDKRGVIEFLGFSRIDGLPMFRAFRTSNGAPQSLGYWKFKADKNTFGETEKVVDAFSLDNGSGDSISADYVIGFGTAGLVKVELVSALEDHIEGFTTNGTKKAMPRDMDEKHYPGIIAPNVTTKRVQVGTVEISSALKITEIEDIKAQTGIDIVQKLESVLVNELSQTISKEIVNKVFEMGELNRASAPSNAGVTIFDFDVDAYFGGNAPGGETTQSAQRKLITKVMNASNYIATEGRVGPASYIVTNGTLAAVLAEGSRYTIQTVPSSSVNAQGQLYPMGQVGNLTVYVDPYMKYNDNRILLGRKNNPEQPGIIFVPYLMAQSVQLISEATFAPRLMLRSRYAVTEVGFFPQKQYMTIYVTDTANVLA